MKVYVYPADIYGCGHYRMIMPYEQVKKQFACDMDVEIIYPSERINLSAKIQGDTVIDVEIPDDADVVVMQRVTHDYLAQAIPIIRKKGVAVVIDMDDDLTRINPKNPAYWHFHPANPTPHNWVNAQRACSDATWVTVTTPALAERYGHEGRTSILKNYVPAWYLDVQHHDSTLVGYAGSLHSHPDDVPLIANAANRLQQMGQEFHIVSSHDGMMSALNLIRPPIGPGALDQARWPFELSKIGIGLAPLADTEFNRAKSWLKMLEMAAVGVPCIGSPRADYSLLHNMGVGLLVEKQKDWIRKIQLLQREDAMRLDLAAQGREAVSRLTYEKKAYEWAGTILAAYEFERKDRSVFNRRG